MGVAAYAHTPVAEAARGSVRHASLTLAYFRADHGGPGGIGPAGTGPALTGLARTVARHQHEGPLRVLKSLYPEGDAVCHHVLVHPPSGVVSGDLIEAAVSVGEGAHALITTPGATRFYRVKAPHVANPTVITPPQLAQQTVRIQVADGGRFEWLPLETIVHDGAVASNRTHIALHGSGSTLGWDVVALGLPCSGQPFAQGVWHQHLQVQGAWLEQARLAADDATLLQSPAGLAGHTVMGTCWFASGQPLPQPLQTHLLQAARDLPCPHGVHLGSTAPHPRVVVARALGHSSHTVLATLMAVRGAWRAAAWGLAAEAPRVWGDAAGWQAGS